MSRILKSSEGSFRPRFDFYFATRAGNYLQNSRGNLCFPILESMKPIQGWGTRLIRAAIGSCYPRSQNRDLGHPPLRNEGRRSRFPPLRARPRGTRHRGPSWCTCRSAGISLSCYRFSQIMRKSREVKLTVLAAVALSMTACRSQRRDCVDSLGRKEPDSYCQVTGGGGIYHYVYGGASGGHVGDSVVGGSTTSRGGFGAFGGDGGGGHASGGE